MPILAVTQSVRRRVCAPGFIRWVLVFCIVAILEAAIWSGLLNKFVVPPPSQTLQALFRVSTDEPVLASVATTILEVFGAGVLISIIGLPLGVVLGRSAVLNAAWASWIAALAAAPIVLLYPLFLVIFGRNSTTIIMIGLVAGLPPVAIKTMEAVGAVRHVFINVGQSFNLTKQQQFLKIIFPAALPGIFVGLRLGLIYAMITIVAVEYLINTGGLGKLVNELAERYDLSGTYAVICLVIGVSVMFFVLLEKCEKWLRRLA